MRKIELTIRSGYSHVGVAEADTLGDLFKAHVVNRIRKHLLNFSRVEIVRVTVYVNMDFGARHKKDEIPTSDSGSRPGRSSP